MDQPKAHSHSSINRNFEKELSEILTRSDKELLPPIQKSGNDDRSLEFTLYDDSRKTYLADRTYEI
jgi:hypothetical protein